MADIGTSNGEFYPSETNYALAMAKQYISSRADIQDEKIQEDMALTQKVSDAVPRNPGPDQQSDSGEYQTADLDRRTPPPLPVLQGSPPLAPHNPNPPGGGPYTIKPGERLSDVSPNVVQAGQKYAANQLGEGSELDGPYLQHPKWEDLPEDRQHEVFNTWQTIHGSASKSIPQTKDEFYNTMKKGSFGVMDDIPEAKRQKLFDSMPEDVERYDIPFGKGKLHFFVRKTPLTSMTDEVPDEIKAGQQYADARGLRERLNSTSISTEKHPPDVMSLIHQIDPLLRGQSGSGAAKPIAPKIKLQEYTPKKLGGYNDIESSSNILYAQYGFKFTDPEGKVNGIMGINPENNGKSLHVNFIRAVDPETGQMAYPTVRAQSSASFTDDITMRDMRGILKQLKERFPEAEDIRGFRITGARAASSAVSSEQIVPLPGSGKKIRPAAAERAAGGSPLDRWPNTNPIEQRSGGDTRIRTPEDVQGFERTLRRLLGRDR